VTRRDTTLTTLPVSTLIERRRLGQTELSVKPGQVNTVNATKPDNLGMFDYAHLRVPLPKDLQGSGIFALQRNQHYPEAYFLMVRNTRRATTSPSPVTDAAPETVE